MSRLSRLFGAHSTGPVYGHGEVPLDQAKPHLLELLRERGAANAVIAYDGGHDEGWITELTYDSTPVDVDSAYDDFQSPDGRLLEAAEAVVCDKWGTFAGEFEVKGRLLVDVGDGRIERHDSVSVEDGPFEDEDEEL
jgi:hypothetical protein